MQSWTYTTPIKWDHSIDTIKRHKCQTFKWPLWCTIKVANHIFKQKVVFFTSRLLISHLFPLPTVLLISPTYMCTWSWVTLKVSEKINYVNLGVVLILNSLFNNFWKNSIHLWGLLTPFHSCSNSPMLAIMHPYMAVLSSVGCANFRFVLPLPVTQSQPIFYVMTPSFEFEPHYAGTFE